jgi:hypothetical protein
MTTRYAVAAMVLVSAVASPSYAFTYLFPESKWDLGGGSASVHGFSAPQGPRSPGEASWSIMPGGLLIHPLATGIDPDHSVLFPSEAITELGVPGFATAADYATMINSAINQWADVSGFTNLGQVVDGGGASGAGDATGDTGDIRIGAWEITASGVLAHNFGPGSATSAGGNNIFGDQHIDVSRTWVNDPADLAGDGLGTYDLYTVILHEIGHALGLGHSDVRGSVMENGYKGGRRVLGADDLAGIQALYGGTGIVKFSVAPGAEGIVPGRPNDVHFFGTAMGFPIGAAVFRSVMDGTNEGIIAPPELSLVGADNIDGLSDPVNGSLGGAPVLIFSVSPSSVGAPMTDVHYNAVLSKPTVPYPGPFPENPGGGDPGDEAAGDLYASGPLGLAAFGYYPSPPSPVVAHVGKNRLYADDMVMGLQAPAENGSATGAPEDNLDGLELDGTPSYFSLSMGSPTAMSPELTVYDGGEVPVVYPVIIHMPGETRTPDDVLLGSGAAIYGPGHSLGLVPGDDIDGLVISDVTFEQFPPPGAVVLSPNGILNPGIDTALFSLAPGSPTLTAGG